MSVIWSGSMIYYALFMIPAAKALGPDGTRFIQHLSGTKKLPVTMVATATIIIITGVLLMQKLFGAMLSALDSTHGIIIIIGALLSLAGFIIGIIVNVSVSKSMNVIGKTLAASGSQPDSALLAELQTLRNKSFSATNVIAVLLFASLILMSAVKYF